MASAYGSLERNATSHEVSHGRVRNELIPACTLADMASTQLRSVSPEPQPFVASAELDGPEGNELLTATNGAVLIVLLAVLGLTIVAIGRLLSVHLFVGLVFVGPLALKLASTGYRFARYYTGAAAYRLKGPPLTPLRLIAPIVVASTLVVVGSGIALLLAGPGSRDTLLPIHKISFFVWLAFMAVHVLAHLPGVASALRLDVAGIPPAPGASRQATRTLLLASALVGGVVLAVLLIPDYGAWLNAHAGHHR
jgi:hypothetical protein